MFIFRSLPGLQGPQGHPTETKRKVVELLQMSVTLKHKVMPASRLLGVGLVLT